VFLSIANTLLVLARQWQKLHNNCAKWEVAQLSMLVSAIMLHHLTQAETNFLAMGGTAMTTRETAL
jgi:hypothetical protein